jgi:hypothetical protein
MMGIITLFIAGSGSTLITVVAGAMTLVGLLFLFHPR